MYTLSQSVSFSGVGLHSGCFSTVIVHPGDSPGFWIKFRNETVRVSPQYLDQTPYQTSLVFPQGVLKTPEHLFSALLGASISSCIIECSSEEVPILDGSSQIFYASFMKNRILLKSYEVFSLKDSVFMESGQSFVEIFPQDYFSVDCSVEFPGQPIFRRKVFGLSEYSKISQARTFCYFSELDVLRASGLAKGGSLENALVLSSSGNPISGEFRFEQECLYHKILDSFGDLAVLGGSLSFGYRAYRPSHSLNAMVLKKAFQDSLFERELRNASFCYSVV